MNRIRVIDVTRLFKKEMLIYSISDLSFSAPVRISQILYTMLLILSWGIPLTVVFWVPPAIGFAIIWAPVFFLGYYLSKPIWGGKSFQSWLKTQLSFFFSSRKYYDLKPVKKLYSYEINNEIQVSRKKDFQYLFELVKEERLNE